VRRAAAVATVADGASLAAYEMKIFTSFRAVKKAIRYPPEAVVDRPFCRRCKRYSNKLPRNCRARSLKAHVGPWNCKALLVKSSECDY
jgi:hypothetical protein